MYADLLAFYVGSVRIFACCALIIVLTLFSHAIRKTLF